KRLCEGLTSLRIGLFSSTTPKYFLVQGECSTTRGLRPRRVQVNSKEELSHVDRNI
ncbi:hypothetical protein W287_02662, partial [Staphylococcus aureus DAR3175]